MAVNELYKLDQFDELKRESWNLPILLARLTLNKLMVFFFSALAEGSIQGLCKDIARIHISLTFGYQPKMTKKRQVILKTLTGSNSLVLAKQFIDLGIVQINRAKV